MGKSSKKFTGLLAAALTVILMMTLLPWTALADSVIDRNATGNLSIELKYGGTVLSGGVFDLYHVATLDDDPVLGYTLTGAFFAAEADGLDINAVRTASELEDAAAVLAKYISGASKTDSVTTQNGTASFGSLALGIYLVVQTGSPTYYSLSEPFLVYIPMTSSAGSEWVYSYTATPKINYNPPGDSSVDVRVVKRWADEGYEDQRPASVEAGLYRNDVLYDRQTLSGQNGWEYVWRGLSPGYTWTVDEVEVPAFYYCLVENAGSNWTLTNTREDVPLGTALNVKKEWSGDDPAARPDSISVTLLCDGEPYETVALTAGGGWAHSWLGLETGHTWSVTEPDVPEGYTSSVETVDDGFVITNSFGDTEPGVDIQDDDVPHSDAPQTGLVQWPIPVLLSAGILLIAFGVIANRGRKRKYGK
jgi:hypothetical protein